MVMEHGEAIRAVVCQEIADLKNAGTRFSLTFDEWTSTRNRRYMNVNVHAAGRQIWNLGMVRVIGTMPAEKCVQLLESKLSNFGLSLTDDIVAICTDGASVMKKVGSLIAAEQQLCYAHAIQLAVLDVLYKGNDKSASDQEPQCNNTESESDLSDDEDDDESQSAESQDFNFIDDANLIAELSDNYNQLVEKVRKIVKIFRRSPTKNDDVLQKYIKAEVGHELSLSLDCKTRWNSLFEMLHRFVSVRNCILKAMIDIKSSVQLSDTDMDDIQDIVSALEPVKLAVEALCRREINLVSGDAVIRFAVVTLEKQRSELAKTLAAAIRLRIKEHRNEFAGVLIYLNNPKATSSDDTFDIPKPATIRKIICNLLQRLDHSPSTSAVSANETTGANSSEVAQASTGNEESEDHPPPKLSLKEQMEQAMKDSLAATSFCVEPKPTNVQRNLMNAVKTEMQRYTSTGNRGRCLQKAHDYLLTRSTAIAVKPRSRANSVKERRLEAEQ
jgi:hypothetical protein